MFRPWVAAGRSTVGGRAGVAAGRPVSADRGRGRSFNWILDTGSELGGRVSADRGRGRSFNAGVRKLEQSLFRVG